jgi:hypothetical protein
VLLSLSVALAQNFVEVGKTYMAVGDMVVNSALERADGMLLVAEVDGKWIKADVDGVEMWFNTDHFMVMRDVSGIITLQSCMQELATWAEVYFIDNGTYADIEVMAEDYELPTACEGATLNTVEANETTYHFTGYNDDAGYQVTRENGLSEW